MAKFTVSITNEPSIPPAVPTTWASQIRKGRKKKGWSQKTLSLYMGVTDMTVSNWEAGKHRPGPVEWRALQELFT